MSVRLPSVRHPRSFYDVFSIVTGSVAIMAIVLTVWYGTLVRLEMVVFMAIVFIWAFWAIERILSTTKQRSKRHQNRPWNRWR